MNNNSNKIMNYESPGVSVEIIKIEKGFAQSEESANTNEFNEHTLF